MTQGARERWLFDDEHPPLAELDDAIAAHYLADEAATVRELIARAALEPALGVRVQATARDLVVAIRAGQRDAGGVGDSEQGLGEAHEHDALARRKVVLAEQRVDSARVALACAYRYDELACGRLHACAEL